jgi:hypothetical protein
LWLKALIACFAGAFMAVVSCFGYLGIYDTAHGAGGSSYKGTLGDVLIFIFLVGAALAVAGFVTCIVAGIVALARRQPNG